MPTTQPARDERVKETRCTAEKPDAKTPYGHFEQSFFPREHYDPARQSPEQSGDVDVNQCLFCGRVSDNQPGRMKILAKLRKRATAVLGLAAFLAFSLVLSVGFTAIGFGFAGAAFGIRDKEMQFLAIDAASVANTVTGESSVDLDTIGVNFASRMGIRIFKVEVALSAGSGTQRWINSAAADTYVNLALRTITSGGTMPDMNDDGVITFGQCYADFVTAVGVYQIFPPTMYGAVFPEGLLVCSDRLYTVVENESDGTLVLDWRIWYKLEKLSDSDYREMWEVWRRA